MKQLIYKMKIKGITYNIKLDDNVYNSLINRDYLITEINDVLYLILDIATNRRQTTIDKYVLEVNGTKVERKMTSHVDGDKCNCTLINIIHGTGVTKLDKSKFKGVSKKESGAYDAAIRNNNKLIYVGLYKTDLEAAIAYNKAMDIIVGAGKYIMNKPNISKEIYTEIYKSISINTLSYKGRKTNQGSNRKLEGTTSKYTGVFRDNSRDRWCARLGMSGTNIFLERYIMEIEAAQEYNEAVLFIHGKYAKTNPVPEPLHPILDLDKLRSKIEKAKNKGR